jgi:hypothetical protein
MTRHLLWLVLGATALACSGPGSSDDDDDDGGSSGESGSPSGGSSGSNGGSATKGGSGGSTSGSSGSSGSGGATSGYYCVNIDTACICVESSSSMDTCATPKPTCCFASTETSSCSCYPPDDPVCSLRGTTGYPAVTTCP